MSNIIHLSEYRGRKIQNNKEVSEEKHFGQCSAPRDVCQRCRTPYVWVMDSAHGGKYKAYDCDCYSYDEE